MVGFDDRGNSSRKKRWPIYKAQRAPKPETLESQLDLAVAVLRPSVSVVVVPPGLEADDVLASVAAQAPAMGARTVVATSDRDSFSLIDEHTRMLRILNGGVDASPLLDPARLAMVTGVRPEQYSDLAALRGDASDNLPGVSGVRRQDRGEAAHRARHGRGRVRRRPRAAASDASRRSASARARTLATTEARERYDLNREVMAMVATADSASTSRPERRACCRSTRRPVRSVFARFELHVPAAVRALTLKEPTRSVEPTYVDPRWSASPAPRFAPLPQLVPSAPAYVQETLF